MPPATTMSASPLAIAWSASMTERRPDPHTMLIVSAATVSGSPPWSAACRAGFCPMPAETTFPMMHSSTCCGSTPARATASRTTNAPRSGAEKSLSAPRNFPVGVRTAERMTDCCDAMSVGCRRGGGPLCRAALPGRPGGPLLRPDHPDGALAEQRGQPGKQRLSRALDLGQPPLVVRGDVEDAVPQLDPGRARE